MKLRKVVPKGARRALTAALCGAWSCAGGVARADAPHPPIVLVLDPCASVDAQEVRRLVPIEMGVPLAAAAGLPGDTTRVFVGCVEGSPQLVHLEVRDPNSGRRVDRVITLVGDSKTDQARLVAIVAVELVAASRSGLLPDKPAAASETPVVTAPPPPASAREGARTRWWAMAFGSMRRFAGLPQIAAGGGLAVRRALPFGLIVGADAAAEDCTQATALGTVDAFVGSLGLLAAWHATRGNVGWESGLGARGGVARLTGHGSAEALMPVRTGAVSGPWVGPMLEERVSFAISRSFGASFGAEFGYVTSGVAGHVQGQPDVALSGAWWSVTLGVAYAR